MFIDDWYSDFYQQLPMGYHNAHVFGQICWSHAYYPHEHLELWRPIPNPNEPTKTYAKEFQLQAAGKDAFNRAIPLHAPKLETYEEFIVVRAKKRPMLVLQPGSSLSDAFNKGYKAKVQRNLCLVAQIFGLADTVTGKAEFSPTFVDRVRRLEFPELLFLPKQPGFLDVDSLLRLDSVQSVFVPQLEATSLAVSAEVATLIQHQLQFLFTGTSDQKYTELREFLLAD
jgi:hypothetical protein